MPELEVNDEDRFEPNEAEWESSTFEGCSPTFRRRWDQSWVQTLDDGAVVHSQTENVGYGFRHYMIVGTMESVLRYYNFLQRNYPPQGYGGHYKNPVEITDGLFIGCAVHSESCD